MAQPPISEAESDFNPDSTDIGIDDPTNSIPLSTVPLLPAPSSSSSSASVSPPNPPSSPQPHLTLLSSISLILSLQIGSGIFSAPSQVSLHVPSPGVGITVWLVAGLLVWTGAATFIELGLRIPRNGGVQEYLRAAWGEFAAFVFVWVYWVIAKPAANAVVAGVGAEYVCGAFARGGKEAEAVSGWVVKIVALVGLWIVTGVNCLGARMGARAANGFLVLKVGVLLSIVGIGFVLLAMGRAPAADQEGFGWWSVQPLGEADRGDEVERSVWDWAGEFLIAIFGGLWCYGGWETIGFVAGEMKDPRRDLPRAINLSMTTVIVGFALLNASLYAVLPMDVVRKNLAVAVEFGSAVFGTSGALSYSILVSVSAWGALNSNVFSAGRLAAAASQRGYFPSIFGKNTHHQLEKDETEYYERTLSRVPRVLLYGIKSFAALTSDLRLLQEVPIYAMIINSLLASVFIMAGTFYGLVTFVGIIEYTFFFLTAAGLRNVRRSSSISKTIEPPPRTRTHNPVIFCILSAVLVLRGLIQDPLQAAFILLALLAAWGLWKVRKKDIDRMNDGN